MTKEFKTLFDDAVVPEPDMGGNWGGTKDGDTSFQGATKGVRGICPEVTFVDVKGGDKPGATAGVGKEIANRKGATD